MRKSNYLKLISFFTVFVWFWGFSRAALLPHFIQEGIAGLSLAFFSFIFEPRPFYIFIVLGTAMLFFPLVLFWRTNLAKSRSYL